MLRTFALLALSMCTSAGAARAQEPADGVRIIARDVMTEALAHQGETYVIVGFRGMSEAASTYRDGYAAALAQETGGRLGHRIPALEPTRVYRHLPAIAARINAVIFEELASSQDVEYVQPDGLGVGALAEAIPAIGGDIAKRVYGLTGLGVRVALLDTGIATAHPDLKHSIVFQQCFTQRACPPNRTSEGDSAEDDHGHGSNIAGIVASVGAVSMPGIAPKSEIVAVKVDDFSNSGRVSDWVAALDWIFSHLTNLQVKIVNLSLSTTTLYANTTDCDAREPALATAIKNLTDAGVVVVAAAGNQGSIESMAAPACNSGVISVAATYDAKLGRQPDDAKSYADLLGSSVADCSDVAAEFDQIACFSNAPPNLVLVAPGSRLTSDGLKGTVETFSGTSQAAAMVTGVIALMLECNPRLTPEEIRAALTQSGERIVDTRSGRELPSLRAADAVLHVCPGIGSSTSKNEAATAKHDPKAGCNVNGMRMGKNQGTALVSLLLWAYRPCRRRSARRHWR